jgi:hypothetical protein
MDIERRFAIVQRFLRRWQPDARRLVIFLVVSLSLGSIWPGSARNDLPGELRGARPGHDQDCHAGRIQVRLRIEERTGDFAIVSVQGAPS